MSGGGEAMTGFDDLPLEIRVMILVGHVEPRWRFCVRPVCKQWLAILADAGDEDRDRPEHENAPDIPWGALWEQMEKYGDHVAACRYMRGCIVLASVIVEWTHSRPNLWDSRPQDLAYWCMSVANASHKGTIATFVASERPLLVRHAVEVMLPECVYGGTAEQDVDYDALYTDKGARRNFEKRLLYIATGGADVESVALALSLLPPADWTSFSLHSVAEGDNADVAEHVLRLWAASVTIDMEMEPLWYVIGGHGAVNVLARFLTIIDMADPLAGDTDGTFRDSGHSDVDSGDETHTGSVDDDTDNENEATEISVTEAHGGVNRSGDDTAGGRSVDKNANAAVGGHSAAKSLSARLARAWRYKGLRICALAAAKEGRVPILALVRSSMSRDLERSIAEAACRHGNIAATRWCMSELGLPANTADLAAMAVDPFYDDEIRLSNDPDAFLDWVFGPDGAAHVPSRDEIGTLFRKAVNADTASALWIAERWPHEIVALGSSALASLVERACSWSTNSRGSCCIGDGETLERLVQVLERCASSSISSDAEIDCDLWTALLSVSREHSEWRDTSAIIHYAWMRATGASADDDDGVEAIKHMDDSGLDLASQAAWARWCRVRPAAVSEFFEPVSESRAVARRDRLIEWMRAKGLIITGGDDDDDAVHAQ